jgi:nitrate reductase gamma subunit
MIHYSIDELARGPFIWFSAAVLFLGSVYRAVEFFGMTKKKEKVAWPKRGVREDSPEERRMRPVLFFQRSMAGKYPVMTIVSGVFHACLLITPVLALGHSLLIRQSWGVYFWSLPNNIIDLLTAAALAGGFFMLLRRILVPRVRAVSRFSDFVFLFITVAPYLTGFMAYHQWLDYKSIITLHMLTGELFLIAIPFTKLVHLVFLFFMRGWVESEHNDGHGGRSWAP